MSCNTQRARLLIKRGSGKPTIPTSPDHTDGTWLVTDIYVGEQYMDTDTGIIYTRTLNDEITQCSNGLIGVYKAQISQIGASAPFVVQELVNTIGDTTYSKVFDGFYQLEFDTDLSAYKIAAFLIDGQSPIASICKIVELGDGVRFETRNISGSRADDLLNLATISVEVYSPQIIS